MYIKVVEYHIVFNFGKRKEVSCKNMYILFICKINLQELFTFGEDGKGMLRGRVNFI